MKREKLIKVILLIISIFCFFSIVNTSFAVADDYQDLVIDPNDFEPPSADDPAGATRLRNIGNDIIGALQIVGTILSVIVLVVLGIKYMFGSVEEKAEYKKTMVPYVIGAIMVFGITNILGIVSKIAQGII